jgi:parallel beta-helix repeat protein
MRPSPRSYGAKAALSKVRLLDIGCTGFWCRGSAACTLTDCTAERCGHSGFYLDVFEVCTLIRCAAKSCAFSGCVFDFPTKLYGKKNAPPKQLLDTPHAAAVRSAGCCVRCVCCLI